MKQHFTTVATVLALAFVATPAIGQTSGADREDATPISVLASAAVQPASLSEPGYVGTVHALLDRGKRYPTGREASLMRPSGVADVWFVLSRNGEVQSVGLERSSGSMLLDGMARSLVHRAAYPSFPIDAWQGANSRRFAVRYTFGDEQPVAVRALDPKTAGR